VAREVSKMFEEFKRGPASKVLGYYEGNAARGEIVLVIGGAVAEAVVWDEEGVRAALHGRLNDGESLSQAAKAVAAESGWKKRDVYTLGREE
jgi:16S rRNA (cytidine1402-2'-O)-methyltransferase